MASKDNANPIIYTTSASQPSTLRPSSIASEWWRDASIHSSHAASSSLANDTLAFSVDSCDALDLDGQDADDDDDGDDGDDIEMPETLAGKLYTDLGSVTGTRTRKREDIDSQEVYDLIRSITDPEHPLTLEQLAVVNVQHITVEQGDPWTHTLPHVLLEFTPTIPHCSMATLIGLSLRVRLLRALPPRFKVDIRVRAGTHQSENAVNKQLNDKERVAAALENAHLLNVVQGCLGSAARRGKSEEDLRREIEEGRDGAGGEVWKTVEEVAKRLGVEV